MGRGRAKAKQTKVARELKYSTPSTDLKRLQDELAGGVTDEADVLATHPEWSDIAGDPYREDEWRRA
ncbi:hypothetical protein TPB0596_38890 [Tsukamurella pulmonis]|uniref:DUF3073 domain-containing protein n=4 Tax=Tsukamurella TaxID=2060 RepID=A0A5C5RKN5_9ACTN|nr:MULTISPECIES: DUF3073 domain-containing protein [Tsukamurella]KXO90050.1 hypothetical protein AXK56_07905 [Tsukamurella pulmonis]KXP11301.1 hypothetical protein AXK57_08140 [Tsukamurella pulmonis]NMD55330.1 DUF3073 domain-containing protein [Tsukamurella columbiensis]RDH13226.1 DUF3073 domain-containing protein [Tsukamurella pulmonis]TWS23270.1 DUF3073 domain-containing protein [Tsukamurella sputi]